MAGCGGEREVLSGGFLKGSVHDRPYLCPAIQQLLGALLSAMYLLCQVGRGQEVVG